MRLFCSKFEVGAAYPTRGKAPKWPIVAKLVSSATILALSDTGQTRVAEVCSESNLYRDIFCNESKEGWLAEAERQPI
jgi:hypothetical protein